MLGGGARCHVSKCQDDAEQGFSGGSPVALSWGSGHAARARCAPFRYRPDRARADFGQADGYIADKKVRLHYFCVYLPHTDDGFVNAFPAEPAETFRDGHVAAFDFSGDNSLTGWMRLC